MKNLIICFILILPLAVKAQTDSIKVSYSEEKVSVFEKTTLLDEYEKAFGGNRIVKSALRLNFAKNLYGNEPQFAPYRVYYEKPLPQIQYEQKIGLDKSIIAGLQWGDAPFLAHFNVELEARWYYRMKKRIDAGIQKANITGKYLSLRAESKPFRNLVDFREYNYLNFGSESIFRAHSSYSLNWGVQFGNFLSYGFSVGMKQGEEVPRGYVSSTNKGKTTWFLTSNTPISLGLYFPRKKKTEKNYCEFLRCNYEVKQLFKLDLTNAFYFDKYLQTLVLDLGYERKLGYTPFSINTSIIAGITNAHINSQYWRKDTADRYVSSAPMKVYYTGNNYEIKQQLRYYLGMKKKIVKRVSAGNLNGVYIGLFGSYGRSASNNKNASEPDMNFRLKYFRIGPYIGYQVQTNRNSFLDININYCLQNSDYISDSYAEKQKGVSLINLNLKFGIAR